MASNHFRLVYGHMVKIQHSFIFHLFIVLSQDYESKRRSSWYLTKRQAMQMYVGVEISLRALLNSALGGSEQLTSRLAALIPPSSPQGKSRYHWIGGSRHLWNVGESVPDSAAQQARRHVLMQVFRDSGPNRMCVWFTSLLQCSCCCHYHSRSKADLWRPVSFPYFRIARRTPALGSLVALRKCPFSDGVRFVACKEQVIGNVRKWVFKSGPND
jgi:hypothetical protein